MRFINLYFVGWVIFVFGVTLALWKAGILCARRAGLDRDWTRHRAWHRHHVFRGIRQTRDLARVNALAKSLWKAHVGDGYGRSEERA